MFAKSLYFIQLTLIIKNDRSELKSYIRHDIRRNAKRYSIYLYDFRFSLQNFLTHVSSQCAADVAARSVECA
jgi:hypothetical protein